MPGHRLRAALVGAVALLASGCLSAVPAPPHSGGATPAVGPYRIALTDPGGTAVRWNPCQPIRYVVNRTHAPRFAMAEIEAAVAALESASGLDLVYAGTTSEPPRADRPARDVARYGAGWSPVLIGFATAAELPFGSPTASGWGDAVPRTSTTGRRQYVTGQVVLRPEGWTQGTSSANPLSLMLRHELGHVVGLAHVSAPTEIMSTAGNGTARRWGSGDRAGLGLVGRPAGCLPVLPVV